MNHLKPVPLTPHVSSPPRTATWRESFKVYQNWACLRMLFLGFSAGLPLLLVFGTLSFWLREAGVDRTTIGYISWVAVAYGFKWLWAPLIDHVPVPLLTRALGRRRSWLLASQLVIIVGLVNMAFTDPKIDLTPLVWGALLVAFASATQDIALDAFRIESADVQHQAAMAATYQTGYRLAMIWAGAGVLWLAARTEITTTNGYQHVGWQTAYLIMALSMLVGVVTVVLSKEPVAKEVRPAQSATEWLTAAFISPFLEFFNRYGWTALLILLLIAVYRISDVVMGVMANPFYVDMGFTKDEVAGVTKVYGVIMTLVGAFVGGVLSMRFGVLRILMVGAILSAATNLLFAWLAGWGHSVVALICVVSADNLASGVASAAFIAYLSGLTNVAYSATQYALFSSMMVLLPKFLAGFSGKFVDTFGWVSFFNTTALLGIPVLLLIYWVMRMPLPASGTTADTTSSSAHD